MFHFFSQQDVGSGIRMMAETGTAVTKGNRWWRAGLLFASQAMFIPSELDSAEEGEIIVDR